MAVSRILSNPRLASRIWTVICLAAGARAPEAVPRGTATNTRKGPPFSRGSGRRPGPSCSVLHRMGFFVPPRLRSGRWAFTPPFHPCRPARAGWRFVFCDTFRRSRLSPRPPARSARHVALWCPDFPLPRASRHRRATVRHQAQKL